MPRPLRFSFRTVTSALMVALGGAACASSSGGSSGGFGTGGSSGTVGGLSGSGGSGQILGGSGSSILGGSGAATDSGSRPMRCDSNGMNCSCFNIASIGIGGHTGAQSGSNTVAATDNVHAFLTYLNTASSIGIAQLGCGTDTGCMSAAKPKLDATFLAQYDVLIFQWMADSITINPKGGFDGVNYWNWGSDELAALKTWVEAGGGIIVLTGYANDNGMNLEIKPANQILQAVSDMQYAPSDTFGVTMTGNGPFCLGDTDESTGWAVTTPLGANITAVGAFHGKTVVPGSGIVDCSDPNPTGGACAAHKDVGKGHVYAYGDEWVTYTSQWNPMPEPATYCSLDGSTANGNFPAAQFAYQVPQFWVNAISYASQATMCPPISLPNTQPPR